MLRLIALLAVCTVCPQTMAASTGGDLDGSWVTDVTELAPTPQLITFTYKGGSWMGTMTSRFGTMELRDIVVENGQVSFSQDFKAGFDPLPLIRVHGAVSSGQLVLQMPAPTGEFLKQTAHKADRREIAAIRSATPATQPLVPVPYNGLARRPPMGWNSSNRFGAQIDDRTVREVADALVSSGLRDLGYTYVNIDDGWQGERDATGVLHSNSKFPDMKGLADYVHSRGLQFGLYSGVGVRTCAELAGSYGHERQDAQMFAQWGVDYLKYDWCSADSNYSTPREMQSAYLLMGAALQATGRPIVYSLCQGGLFDVGRWGRKVGANLWRTSWDLADYWQRMDSTGFDRSGRAGDSGPGGWNDPDMLEIGNGGMSTEEYRTHFILWSMLSAPLLLGNDVRSMSTEIKTILTNTDIIAIDQDALGISARPLPPSGMWPPKPTEVWLKPLADGSTAIALFNRADTPHDARLNWSELGITGNVTARDLTRHTDVSLDPLGYHASLPPHGAVLLRVSSREPSQAH